jgi:hypothetical protein
MLHREDNQNFAKPLNIISQNLNNFVHNPLNNFLSINNAFIS